MTLDPEAFGVRKLHDNWCAEIVPALTRNFGKGRMANNLHMPGKFMRTIGMNEAKLGHLVPSFPPAGASSSQLALEDVSTHRLEVALYVSTLVLLNPLSP